MHIIMAVRACLKLQLSSLCLSLLYTNTKRSVIGDVLAPKEDESTSFDPTYVEDTMYMYFPNRLPAQRQLNYQLCDIMDDQLQKIIHGNDGKEKECTVSTYLVSYIMH